MTFTMSEVNLVIGSGWPCYAAGVHKVFWANSNETLGTIPRGPYAESVGTVTREETSRPSPPWKGVQATRQGGPLFFSLQWLENQFRIPV